MQRILSNELRSLGARDDFNENLPRIVALSILTAFLLGGLVALIVATTTSMLWLQITAPILVGVLVGISTIFGGLTGRLSPETKQILLMVGVAFVGLVALSSPLLLYNMIVTIELVALAGMAPYIALPLIIMTIMAAGFAAYRGIQRC